MVAKTVGFAFTLAMPIVLVRVLSQVQFGTYKQAFLIVASAQSILPFSFGLSAFYFLPRAPELSRQIVCNIVLYYASIGTLAMLAVWLWPDLLRIIVGDTALTQYAGAIAVILLTWVFSSFLEMIATANADVAYSTIFIIAAQFTKAALLISAAAWFRTVGAVLYAAVAQGVLQSCILLWYLNRRFPRFWTMMDPKVAREQISYVVPIGISGALYILSLELHNYVVSHNFNTAEYAIYAVGTAQIPLVGILRDSVNVVLMSRISKLQSENEPEQIIHLTIRAWRKLAAALLPASAVLLVLGREFIEVLYTDKYLSSWPVFMLNLTLLPMGIFITDSVLRAYAEYRFWNLKLRVFLVFVQIILSFVCIRWFGLLGALLGLVLTTAADRIISLYKTGRILGFSRVHAGELADIWRFALATGLASLVTWLIVSQLQTQAAFVRLVLGLIIFGLAYVAAVVMMRLPDEDERNLVNRYSLKFAGLKLLS